MVRKSLVLGVVRCSASQGLCGRIVGSAIDARCSGAKVCSIRIDGEGKLTLKGWRDKYLRLQTEYSVRTES